MEQLPVGSQHLAHNIFVQSRVSQYLSNMRVKDIKPGDVFIFDREKLANYFLNVSDLNFSGKNYKSISLTNSRHRIFRNGSDVWLDNQVFVFLNSVDLFEIDKHETTKTCFYEILWRENVCLVDSIFFFKHMKLI